MGLAVTGIFILALYKVGKFIDKIEQDKKEM